MNAKEYLESIRMMDTIINGLLKERDQLSGLRYKITQELNPVRVSGGGKHEGFTGASNSLIDLEDVINREIDRYADMKKEAMGLLKQLKNPKHYEVLHRHYILFEDFDKIAEEMGKKYRGVPYTWRNACSMNGRALQVFQKVLDRHGD